MQIYFYFIYLFLCLSVFYFQNVSLKSDFILLGSSSVKNTNFHLKVEFCVDNKLLYYNDTWSIIIMLEFRAEKPEYSQPFFEQVLT